MIIINIKRRNTNEQNHINYVKRWLRISNDDLLLKSIPANSRTRVLHMNKKTNRINLMAFFRSIMVTAFRVLYQISTLNDVQCFLALLFLETFVVAATKLLMQPFWQFK